MRIAILIISVILLVAPTSSRSDSQTPESNTSASARFHHVHLNSIDPAAATRFYTRTFDQTKATTLAGFAAVQSEAMFLLFNRVSTPPTTNPDSAIWHFGWGSTAMETDYNRYVADGVTFHTPLTKLGSGLLFAYMKAPDGALVEINTSNTRSFIHAHLFSAAPLCAADWYVAHLGATTRSSRERSGGCDIPFSAPSEPLGVIRAPSATVRFGDISLIIYPRQKPAALESPRGHVVDHLALTVPNLADTLARLKQSGVKIMEHVRRFGDSSQSAAMIEGPDAIAIELIEAK